MNYCKRIRLVEERSAGQETKFWIEYDTKTKTNVYPADNREEAKGLFVGLVSGVDEWVEENGKEAY